MFREEEFRLTISKAHFRVDGVPVCTGRLFHLGKTVQLVRTEDIPIGTSYGRILMTKDEINSLFQERFAETIQRVAQYGKAVAEFNEGRNMDQTINLRVPVLEADHVTYHY